MMNQTPNNYQYNPYAGNMYGYNYGMPAYGMAGPVYNQAVKMPEYTNPLGQQKIQELLKNGKGAPSIVITEDDYNQAICTHRNPANYAEQMLYPIGDGKVKCKICGAEFHLVQDPTQEDVQQCTDNMWDLLNAAKVMWLDVPNKVAAENFQILAVLGKAPQIFSIASNAFNKYGGDQAIAGQAGAPNGFAQLNMIMGGFNGYNPAAYNPAAYNPVMYQPPMGGMQVPPVDPTYNNPMAQQMLAAAPGMSNGFGVMNPTQQPPQQVTISNLNPAATATVPNQQVQPAPAATAPAGEQPVRVTETLSV